MLALTAPIVLTPLITYLRPENYDFKRFQEIELVDDSAISGSGKASPGHGAREITAIAQEERVELLRARNIALGAALFIAISMTILWPIPMYGTGYIFSKRFFTGWIVVTFIWAFFGAITITCLPLWQSRRQVRAFFAAVLGGSSGHGKEEDIQASAVVVEDKT